MVAIAMIIINYPIDPTIKEKLNGVAYTSVLSSEN